MITQTVRKMSVGYAEQSSRISSLLNGQPETIVVGETECAKATFLHDSDGWSYFRHGRKFYRQLTLACEVIGDRHLFDESDVERNHIYTPGYHRDFLVYNPPQWLANGLTETRSGYGLRLNSGYSIWFEGKLRRIYVTQISNAGSAWFKCNGRTIYVS